MPSALAERIIAACEAVKKLSARIPKCQSFGDVSTGVYAENIGDKYRLITDECCPLGAVLVNMTKRNQLFYSDLRELLCVDSEWIEGFVCYRLPSESDQNSAPSQFEGTAGGKVAIEVLAWVNAQVEE